MDNRSLRTEFAKIQYVLIVKRDGVKKYISKAYGSKHDFEFTVLLNKAKKFDKIDLAKSFVDNYNIQSVIEIKPMKYNLILER